MEYPFEKLKDSYLSIPEDLRNLMSSTEVPEQLDEIASKNKLTPEQLDTLAEQIGLVTLGLVHLRDFVSNIQKELGVPPQVAQTIGQDVSAKIFSVVKDSLRQLSMKIEAQEKKAELTNTKPETPIITMPKTFPTQPVQEAPEQVIQKPTPPKSNILERQGATALRPDHMLTDHEGLEAIDGPHLHSQNIMPQEQGARPAQTGGTIIDDKLSRMVRMPKQDVNIPAKESYKGSDPYREPAN